MPATKHSVALALGLGKCDPSNLQNTREIIAMAKEKKIKILDTTHFHGGSSESFIGSEGLSSNFQITTKACMSLVPGGASKEGIVKGWAESEEALKTDRISNYLLHSPDENTPISETMEGIQSLYLAGKFEHFGLSNFTANQVEECYNYAKSKSYILPTIYQSIYSLAVRRNETELFPTLRRLNISIQAYSALASGFLAKTPEDVKSGKGTYNHGAVSHEQYGRPSYLKFLEEFRELAREAGCSTTGIAYRWMAWNSVLDGENGDCIILGASSARQLKESVEEIENGPLEDWVVDRLEEMWQKVAPDCPGNSFEVYQKLVKVAAG